MNPHLTTQEIAEWIAGQKTAAMEEHLRGCEDCAATVERATEPLALFRTSVRALGDRQMGFARFVLPAERPVHPANPFRWGLAMATAVALMVAAIPVARHFHLVSPAATPVVVPTVSDDALLQQVETEISRSVPSTLEPLAKLMSSDDNRKAE